MSKNWDALEAADNLTGNETFPVNQAGKTKYSTINKIIEFLGNTFATAAAIGTAITDHLTAFAHEDIEHTNRIYLDLVSGENTGDQDLSPYALKTEVPLYEAGDWTPADASTAGLTITFADAKYTKIGRMVFLSASVTYPTTADATTAAIGGLPFNPAAPTPGSVNCAAGTAANVQAVPGSKVYFYNAPNAPAARLNSAVSGLTIRFNIAYQAA